MPDRSLSSPLPMAKSHTRASVLALGSVALLWTGKAIPSVPTHVTDVAAAGHLILLSVWLGVLARVEWTGEGSPFRGWKTLYLPLGLGLGVAAFVVAGLGYAVSDRVLRLTAPAEAGLLVGFGARFFLLAGIALSAAVIEEWVLRGVVLSRLQAARPRGAVLLSSLVFAAYHLSLFQALPTFLLGVVLAAAVVRFQSLWPAVVAHVAFNLVGLLLTAVAAGS